MRLLSVALFAALAVTASASAKENTLLNLQRLSQAAKEAKAAIPLPTNGNRLSAVNILQQQQQQQNTAQNARPLPSATASERISIVQDAPMQQFQTEEAVQQPAVLNYFSQFLNENPVQQQLKNGVQNTGKVVQRLQNEAVEEAAEHFEPEEQPEEYDYIIIGAGGAGCPLAATLGEMQGKKILLLERGAERKIYDSIVNNRRMAGIAWTYGTVIDQIITKQGVRSNVGRVMSGGTAVNYGITIGELDEYFDWLASKHGLKTDKKTRDEAYAYVFNLMTPSPLLWNNDLYNTSLIAAGYSKSYGHRQALATDGVWRTYTTFRGTDAPDFGHRVGSDEFLPKNSRNIHLKTNSTVVNIEFSKNAKTGVPKAQCVRYKRTQNVSFLKATNLHTRDPWAPAGVNTAEKTLEAVANRITADLISLNAATTAAGMPGIIGQQASDIGNRYFYEEPIPESELTESVACVRPGGEVILSAGAVYTPQILMESGIGPRGALAAAGVSVVKNLPYVGANLHDRIILPIGMFVKPEYRQEMPSIAQVAALQPFGKNCNGFNINSDGLECSLIGFEETSWANSISGILLQSRFLLPPELRNTGAADLLFGAIGLCDPVTYGDLPSDFCNKLQMTGIFDCLSRGIGWALVLSFPKSRGFVSINKNGDVLVDPAYITHDADVVAATTGIKKLLETIANAEVNEQFRSRFVTKEEYLNGDCPAGIYNGLLTAVQQLTGYLDVNTRQQMLQIGNLFGDILAGKTGGFRSSFPAPPSGINLQKAGDGIKNFVTGYDPYREEGPAFGKKGVEFATFPVRPRTSGEDDKSLLSFVYTHMTSMWHIAGSMKMGSDSDATAVVDNTFRVKGVEQLSVVDASVFPQLTRLNPAISVMMLGRYAGIMRQREQGFRAD